MFEDELAFANELADRAATIAMDIFGGELGTQFKADSTPVTQADLRIEAMVRDAIANRFPGDAIFGEEGGQTGKGERVWVIDPIDATKNFVAGIQIWATLIALVVDNVPSVGVVSAPALGERYTAAKDGGAFLNGNPIHVSDVAQVSSSFLLTPSLKELLSSSQPERFLNLARQAKRNRGFGDFWGHMMVARGSAEIMLEPSLRIWDIAAVRVVVEQAGGRVTNFGGGEFSDGGSALSTNGALHDEVVKLLGLVL